MAKNLNEESCKHCAGYAQIQTDYGTVRRCEAYKKLLEESHVEKKDRSGVGYKISICGVGSYIRCPWCDTGTPMQSRKKDNRK